MISLEPMGPVYLTPTEAAEQLGVSRWTIVRRLEAGSLPGLRLPSLCGWRVEACAVLADTPAPLPPGPRTVSVQWAARIFRVRTEVIRTLLETGALPAERQGMRWQISRRALLRWVVDHSTGEDLP